MSMLSQNDAGAPAAAHAAAFPDGRDPQALALLGHDIRAALSDVIGGLRLIDPDRVDPETRLQLGRMRAAGELLARLLEEGLGVMLGDEAAATPPANVQLSRLLGDLRLRWSARARDKGLEFTLAEGDALPVLITADRIGLERALSNLLSNAIKHSDRGRVELAVARDPSGGLVFRVVDEGPGFSEAALARLFEFAARPHGADRPGQGLGLHIAKGFAGRAGGELLARNRPEGGAEVTLTLPPEACLPCPGHDSRDSALPLPDLTRHRVLVADDSPTNLKLISLMLERLGAEVEQVEDGIAAVTALEQENYDLALIDIEMPGLNGIDVIRNLRAMGGRQGRIPVLACTAYVLRANREAIYAAGADAILSKPLGGIEVLGQTVARLLSRTAGGPSPPSATLPEQPGDDAPEMDPGQFDRLLEVAGPQGSRELLTRLAEDLRLCERQIVAALPAPDWAELRSQTHVLIALAGAVGARRLQHRAEAANVAAHRRDRDAVAAQGDGLVALLDRLIHFVTDVLRRREGLP